jgi:hypothetical protein
VDRRPHQLSTPWRIVFGVGWGGVVLCLAAVWTSSRTMGLSTWWLGAPADPMPLVVQVLPFVLPIAMVVGAFRNVRFLPLCGVFSAGVLAAIAIGDLEPFHRYGVVEAAAATAGMLVSLASFAGLLRPERSEPSN